MVITSADREQLRSEGWVLVRGVVPPNNVRAALRSICAFHEIVMDDPTTWYRVPPECWDIVPVHHAESFWDNRALPTVHAAFAELIGTERLWVSMDRGSLKPPASGHPAFDRTTALHWDAKPRERLRDPRPWLQGLVFLTDTTPERAPFECVPSLFRDAADWLAAHSDANDEPDVAGREVVQVTGKAGDLVVWNALLPHRPGNNDADAPRAAQYIAMHEAGTRKETAQERVALWRDRRVPPGWRSWPPTVIDPEPGPVPELDALGRRLLGLDPW